jgi:hypothetical protein
MRSRKGLPPPDEPAHDVALFVVALQALDRSVEQISRL